MQANEYQKWCKRFDKHKPETRRLALALGLCAEAGEVANQFERVERVGEMPFAYAGQVADELGDVLWNVARLADELGFPLENLLEQNINKLIERHGTSEDAA